MTRRTPEEIEEMKRKLKRKLKRRPTVQKKNFSAYLPPELLERLKDEAKKERRSVNGQLCLILERYFEQNPRPEA